MIYFHYKDKRKYNSFFYFPWKEDSKRVHLKPDTFDFENLNKIVINEYLRSSDQMRIKLHSQIDNKNVLYNEEKKLLAHG